MMLWLGQRNDKILYYDCSNYYFEIEQEDGDGIPLAFSLFPGNTNEQKSLKPLEQKVIREFGCQKFIYCSDAGLASEDIRTYNHMGERAFIVTQSILPDDDTNLY